MDDPWGSPWADEQNNTSNAPPKIQVKPGVLVQAPVYQSNEVAPSPWGDEDDGFEDWATSPTAGQEPASSLSTFATVSSSWDPKSHKDGNSEPWNNRTVLDERLKPAGLSPSEPANVVREPSPDPWATRLTEQTNVPLHITKEFDGDAHEVDSDATVTGGNLQEEVKDRSVTPEVKIEETILTKEEDGNTRGYTRRHSIDAFIPEPGSKTADAVRDRDADHEFSRPSSAPSDNSHHDDAYVDSPRTSLDDDVKRPQMPREVSSKVHELVEHFDALAKAEVEDPIVTGRPQNDDDESFNPKISQAEMHAPPEHPLPERSDETEDDDFGDFEDGLEDGQHPITPISTADRARQIATPETPEAPKSTTTPDVTPRKIAITKKFGRVEYPVGVSYLTELFPSVVKATPEKVFLPDFVPHGSFSSVEERKTWYRISRYGSMKKHDTGNDENYVRTTWPQSEARASTLKIVARWMEEDRMSGRVVLGGGSNGSSFFGWNDASSGPVSLAAAFGMRPKKKLHIQTVPELELPRKWPEGLSKESSSSKPRRRSSVRSSNISVDTEKDTTVPVATFGWASEPQPTSQLRNPSFVSPSPTSRKRSASRQDSGQTIDHIVPFAFNESRPPLHTEDVSALTPIVQTPTVVTKCPIVATPLALNLPLAEVDGWGDMISTPKAIAPIFPPLPISSYERSQQVGSIPDSMASSLNLGSGALLSSASQDVRTAKTSAIENDIVVEQSGIHGPSTHKLPVAEIVETSTIAFKDSQATFNNFSIDDLDPWGSSRMGTNTTSSTLNFASFTPEAVSQSAPQSAASEPDPCATLVIPQSKHAAAFDVFGDNPHAGSMASARTLTSATSTEVFGDPFYRSSTSSQPAAVTPTAQVVRSIVGSRASADFSFFDTPAATVPLTKAKASPLLVAKPKRSTASSSYSSQTKHIPSPLSQAMVFHDTSTTQYSTTAPAVRGNSHSRAEAEQDRIVADIIKGLPDLSYMLR